MTVATAFARRDREASGSVAPDEVTLGKDVLELISTAMYIDPMTIYREYIQNAADAIDEACSAGIFAGGEAGRIDIYVDPTSRSVRIRDNGIGIASSAFVMRMTALGGSAKRGTSARGFRGVGRLSGLGFAQELVFRSRVTGQKDVSELRWDCRKLKTAFSDSAFSVNVADLISEVVSVAPLPPTGYPERFFEVELVKVVRQRGDKLMDASAVADYLSQIAPVPFAPDFHFAEEIVGRLQTVTRLGEIEICINDGEALKRPHRNEVELGPAKTSLFEEITILEIPGVDGDVAAVAWFLHHGYEGALSAATMIKGVRLRVGNLQVGGHTILEDMFPEARFNSWSVGEVHVVDPRIIPNGRRDHFEQNAHFNNLVNQLGPSARDIARRCRTNSARRSKLRQFELAAMEVRGRIDALRQGGLSASARKAAAFAAEATLARMEKIAGLDLLVGDAPDELRQTVEILRKKLTAALGGAAALGPLDRLPPKERKMYERMFDLIYACSTNRTAAKALIDRILVKIAVL